MNAGRADQDRNGRKRNPPGLNAENEEHARSQFRKSDHIRGPSGKAVLHEELHSPGKGEDQDFQQAVRDEHDAQCQTKQQGGKRCRTRVEHLKFSKFARR